MQHPKWRQWGNKAVQQLQNCSKAIQGKWQTGKQIGCLAHGWLRLSNTVCLPLKSVYCKVCGFSNENWLPCSHDGELASKTVNIQLEGVQVVQEAAHVHHWLSQGEFKLEGPLSRCGQTFILVISERMEPIIVFAGGQGELFLRKNSSVNPCCFPFPTDSFCSYLSNCYYSDLCHLYLKAGKVAMLWGL